MTLAGSDNNIAVRRLVNNPVFAVYTAAPPTAEVLFQRLRFPKPGKGAALNIFYQRVDPF